MEDPYDLIPGQFGSALGLKNVLDRRRSKSKGFGTTIEGEPEDEDDHSLHSLQEASRKATLRSTRR